MCKANAVALRRARKTSLTVGWAGIGYFYLRLAHPKLLSIFFCSRNDSPTFHRR